MSQEQGPILESVGLKVDLPEPGMSSKTHGLWGQRLAPAAVRLGGISLDPALLMMPIKNAAGTDRAGPRD